MWKIVFLLASLIASLFLTGCAEPEQFRIATTTSLEATGLLDVLVPVFEKEAGVKMQYVSVGTGQALRLARDGNADLVFVHDREAEEEFIRQGFGTERTEVMINYFTIVGPPGFEGELGQIDICGLMKWISGKGMPFVSRGDESGTHSREKFLWKNCGVERPAENYFESGSSMVATLRLASEKKGFTLSDTATFRSHAKDLSLVSYSGKDPLLRNVYSVIPVSPEKIHSAKIAIAKQFVDFVVKGSGREIIMNHGKKELGEPLFMPVAE